MQNIVLKLNRITLVIIITFVAVVMAISLDELTALILNHEYKTANLIRATIIPLVIAPFISWYFIGLLLQIDRIKKKMVKIASYDELTGLLNRRTFYVSTKELHKESRQNFKNYCALIFDVDSFKKINNTHGHEAADLVLCNLSAHCKKVTRKSDLIGRIGGDEFAFILPDTDLSKGILIAKELLKEVQSSQPIYQDTQIDYSLSIGLAENTACLEQSLDDTLTEANNALSKSIADGGARININ